MKRTGFMDTMVKLRTADDSGNAYVDPSLITHIVDVPSGKGCIIGIGGIGSAHVMEPADCVVDKITLKRTKEYSPTYALAILKVLYCQLVDKEHIFGHIEGIVSARSILKAHDLLPSDMNESDERSELL